MPLPMQPLSQSLPPVDALDSLDSPSPGAQEDVSDAACLASMNDLPRENLKAANDKFFGVYQDWVYQNPGTHLDGWVDGDVRWQKKQEKNISMRTQHYDVPSSRSEIGMLGLFWWILKKVVIAIGIERG